MHIEINECPVPVCLSPLRYDTDPPEVSAQTPTSLHWMRMSALRIHDNPALKHCLEHVGTRFRCVFILDPWFVCNESKIGVNR